MLRSTGFDVFEAGNGSAAIDLLRAKPGRVDLILLDLTIPGASSHEVVAGAAKLDPRTKVIMTSTYSQDTITRALDGTQVVSFVRKPFRIGHLLQSIRNALAV